MDNFNNLSSTQNMNERLNSEWIANIPATYSLFLDNAVNESTDDDLEQIVVNTKTVGTLGEVIAAPVSDQSTELNNFKTGTKTKSYNKYLNAITWHKKGLNPTYANFSSISNQALNKLLAQEDAEFISGKDSNGVMQNNGLFNSLDPDAVIETSATAVPTALDDLYEELEGKLEEINKVCPGQKYVFTWGGFKKSLRTFSDTKSEKTIQNIIETNLDGILFPKIITDITGGDTDTQSVGNGGYIIATPSALRMHHARFTQILQSGNNVEKMYLYLNLGYNSKSLELLAPYALYKKVYTA